MRLVSRHVVHGAHLFARMRPISRHVVHGVHLFTRMRPISRHVVYHVQLFAQFLPLYQACSVPHTTLCSISPNFSACIVPRTTLCSNTEFMAALDQCNASLALHLENEGMCGTSTRHPIQSAAFVQHFARCSTPPSHQPDIPFISFTDWHSNSPISLSHASLGSPLARPPAFCQRSVPSG